MRLYLSSYRTGNSPLDLVALAGEGSHAAVIANAGDCFGDPAERAKRVSREHFRSDHPERALVDTCVERLIDAHEPFVALRDGEAAVVDSTGWRVTPTSAGSAPDVEQPGSSGGRTRSS